MSAAAETALNLADRSQSLPVVECKFCGAEIAWCTSKRTGKRYPAQVVRTPSESATRLYNLRVAPWQPHTRAICEAEQQRRREGVERITAEAGKATGETCGHHDCFAPSTHIVHHIDPRSGEVSESTASYCDEHTKVVAETNEKMRSHDMTPAFTDPEPLS